MNRETEAKTRNEPEIRRVTKAATLVKGAGGMSGQDRNWYWYFYPDE